MPEGNSHWLPRGRQSYFQCWFRDGMVPGGSGFNLSNALSVTFCP